MSRLSCAGAGGGVSSEEYDDVPGGAVIPFGGAFKVVGGGDDDAYERVPADVGSLALIHSGPKCIADVVMSRIFGERIFRRSEMF